MVKPTKDSPKIEWFKYWAIQPIAQDLDSAQNEVAWLQMKLIEAIEIIEGKTFYGAIS